jgi:two-component system invasion response regulator UvrY
MLGTMIQVLVADDHDSVRQQIVRLIERTDDMTVTAEAADGVEVLERFESSRTDVLILDLTMPRKGGIETLRDLLPRHPDAKVLVVSMHPPEQLAHRVIRAGARGYVGKDRVAECLLDAIRAVHAGDVYVDPGEQPSPGGAEPSPPEARRLATRSP